MRCRACNVALSDDESVRKDGHGGYLDLCNYCYHAIDNAEIEAQPDDKLLPQLEDEDGVEVFDNEFFAAGDSHGDED